MVANIDPYQEELGKIFKVFRNRVGRIRNLIREGQLSKKDGEYLAATTMMRVYIQKAYVAAAFHDTEGTRLLLTEARNARKCVYGALLENSKGTLDLEILLDNALVARRFDVVNSKYRRAESTINQILGGMATLK